MFIKRNHTEHAGKAYESILLVQGKRVPAKRPPGRPAAGSPPPKTRVVHRTLANLSKLPSRLVAIIEDYCRGRKQAPEAGAGGEPAVHVGPCYGLLAGLHALARELGIAGAVGEATRTRRLALYLVYARLAHRGSRLSAARFSEDHAVGEILRVGRFDEDDLYGALDWLAEEQERIENRLAAERERASPSAVFLYDVTSVYFEGRDNELAQYGYNRDKKRGKKRMVAGLLTDAEGEPLSIALYPGNTSDPPTFLDAVATLKVRFGREEIALVGDRGMIKAMGKQALGKARFRYVSALTDPQVRKLLKRGVIRLELFDEKPAEVELETKRYILRCNPRTRERERARRADRWARVKAKIAERNEACEEKSRMQPESSLRQARGWIKQYRLGAWVKVSLEGRRVLWEEEAEARAELEQLDGCYVLETDLPAPAATTVQVHDRYMGLTKVERDFRTLKTGLLAIRPVFLRKANRTRAHALVSLLALKLARELDRRVAPLGLTVSEALERLEGVKLVRLGDKETGLWRLADSYPAAQQEVLEVLPKLPAPVLSLGKANRNRLENPRQGRR